MTTLIRIHVENGNKLVGRADFGKGSPANPFSYDEVAEKFHGCAEFARWPQAKAEKIVSLVAELETLDDLGQLTAGLAA